MKNVLLGALLGLAVGYSCGYSDSEAGEPRVTTRILDRFGVGKVRDAQESREKKTQEAIR